MPSFPFSAGIFLLEHRKFKSSRYPAFSGHPLKPCGIWERIAKSLAQTAGCLESHSQKNGNKLTSQVEKLNSDLNLFHHLQLHEKKKLHVLVMLVEFHASQRLNKKIIFSHSTGKNKYI